MTYIGFVLTAMGTDFYPRLTAVIADHRAVNTLVNQQIEVGLTVSSPLFVALLAFAPWIVELLYSHEFVPAITVLRWQIIGDVLKVASWPLGYILLAAGEGRQFFLTEFGAAATFVAVTTLLLPHRGLEATGLGFIAMYVSLGATVYWLARRRTGFRLARRNAVVLLTLLGSLAVVQIAARLDARLGAGVGAVICVSLAGYAARHLTRIADLSGPLARVMAILRLKGR